MVHRPRLNKTIRRVLTSDEPGKRGRRGPTDNRYKASSKNTPATTLMSPPQFSQENSGVKPPSTGTVHLGNQGREPKSASLGPGRYSTRIWNKPKRAKRAAAAKVRPPMKSLEKRMLSNFRCM